MFGRRRIRQLEAEVKVLRDALDWYAVNDNWRRRSTHAKGTPVRWEMSPAQRDHGGRARAATLQADAIRAGKPTVTVTVPAPLDRITSAEELADVLS